MQLPRLPAYVQTMDRSLPVLKAHGRPATPLVPAWAASRLSSAGTPAALAVAAFAATWPSLAPLLRRPLPGPTAAAAALRGEAACCCTLAMRADDAAAATVLMAVADTAGTCFALPGGHAFGTPLAAALDLLGARAASSYGPGSLPISAGLRVQGRDGAAALPAVAEAAGAGSALPGAHAFGAQVATALGLLGTSAASSLAQRVCPVGWDLGFENEVAPRRPCRPRRRPPARASLCRMATHLTRCWPLLDLLCASVGSSMASFTCPSCLILQCFGEEMCAATALPSMGEAASVLCSAMRPRGFCAAGRCAQLFGRERRLAVAQVYVHRLKIQELRTRLQLRRPQAPVPRCRAGTH